MNDWVKQVNPVRINQPTSNEIIRDGKLGPPVIGQISHSEQSIKV